MALGAVAFTVVSLAGYSVWAFAGRWFYANVGELGLYAVIALVFVALAGLLMYPLLVGPRRLVRFYSLFVPGFLAYAVVWCVAWFALRFGAGEWIGSLAGSVVFAVFVSWRLGRTSAAIGSAPILFVCHSAGYFAGGMLMGWLMGPSGTEFFSGLTQSQLSALAKLSWGLPYGLGFGAGLGAVFALAQRPAASPALSEAGSDG